MKPFLVTLLFLLSCNKSFQTPLDDYVNTPDPNYKYELIHTYELQGYRLYILNMTSQRWQDETVVQNPIWWHYVSVAVPDKIFRPDASLMFIGGGSNRNSIPDPTNGDIQIISNFSLITGTISAIVQQVPNQPYIFTNDPDRIPRSEDEVISWTWKLFLQNTSNPQILLRFPMTKAVVRAMDTVEDFASKNFNVEIKKFMTTGKSKRGWTTWTTAAVDYKRVFAAAPIVMDLANLNANFHNHFKSLGGWTFEFYDYYSQGILNSVDTRGLFEMEKMVDPLTYFDRYKQTQILVMTAANDEFFLPDDTYVYWDSLVGATDGSVLLRRFDNVGHSLEGKEIQMVESLTGIFVSTYENNLKPRVRWTRPNNSTHGILRAFINENDIQPYDVSCFYAFTLDDGRRDFRRAEADPNDPSSEILHPVKWINTKDVEIKKQSNSIVYEIAFEKPSRNYFGFYLEFRFKGVDDLVNVVNTEVNIIPETFPSDDCSRDSCNGNLV